jgi:Fe2+ transport system protein FeoA
LKQDHLPGKLVEGHCAQPDICPLSQVKAGTTVCVRGLTAAPDVQDRLREIGFAEDQKIRLLTSQANVICQVCNARVAISQQLAEAILVEPLNSVPR